ncbi:AMP-binding protein [Pseudonocardia hydrocarbonoxydans]|uniref:AMP-dependent synthetase n=1 Tax=Pseudonocardia hydrocarbonoxydans TaxID=76726 RepID=A0A4Y3WQR4_9PSEU|nr:AMP-dependent synthetase [Pseudonocardia hydrocarbonoxydans]
MGPDGGSLTYRDLADRVDDVGDRLGARRRLVLLGAGNDVDTLVTHLAALRGGHPVLLAAGQDPRTLAALTARYDPDVVAGRVDGAWTLVERRRGSAHDLHPDLAVLLSTSGSTGSPKLVRIPASGVVANADAIGEYLDIRPTDRAATTLPLHYCYGLSVVHSNLARGAALLLSDRSVTDPGFWTAFRDGAGTSLHAVPHTVELLDRVGFPEMELPHLRYLTQAGGRLAPDVVRRYARLGERRGWRFFVMYGQTEATARMAYLPPERAAECPGAVGVPIPGGSLDIEDPDPTGTGELVYRGANVMLGYAEQPADLTRGRDVHALRTGDLARRRPDGMIEIVGRRSRVVKPFGLRIDLDRVEQLLAAQGCTAACTGDDARLVVAVTGGADTARVRRFVAERTGLPDVAVRVVGLPELPRRPNGKIDYAAVARHRPRRRMRWPTARPRTVPGAFRAVFPLAALPPDATFTSLGGDSLSYVQMTLELQRALGHLPADWETTTIGALSELPRRTRVWVTAETGVVLRAVAIVLVVGSHVGLFDVKGGAHLLMGVTGWAFARFVLAGGPRRWTILRATARIAVPTALWIAWRARTEDDVVLSQALLVNQFLDPSAWGYWYVESLCQILLVLGLLLAVPAVRRCERARPLGFALGLLGVALVGRLFPLPGNEFSDRLMSTHLVLWLFVLGWVVARSTGPVQRVAVAGLVVVLVPGFFDSPLRAAVVTGGLLLLALAPRIAVPRPLVRPVGAVAGASLAVYLTHYAVYPELLPHASPLPVVVACVVTGIGVQAGLSAAARSLARAHRALRHRTVTPLGQPFPVAVPSSP